MFKKIDLKYFGFAFILLLLGGCTYIFWYQILKSLKAFFEIRDLNLFAGGISTIFTVLQKIKTKKIRFSASMSFNEFRKPTEEILSFVGTPITLVCSLSLAKGLFLQLSGTTKYFPLFNDLELTFVGLVTIYLIFISILDLFSKIKETLLSNATTEEPTAIPPRDVHMDVPDPK